MNENYKVSDLVPHSGCMSLLDEIIDVGDDSLKAAVNISDQSMFVEEQGVSAIIGIEYLAQGIAAYAGSRERLSGQPPKLGFLLGVRNYECSTDYFPIGSKIIIEVKLEMKADNGLNVFQCQLTSHGFTAHARLNVFQPEDVQVFLKGIVS